MKEKLHRRSGFLFAAFLAAFLSACVLYAFRELWVFFSSYLFFIGGAMGLFWVLIAAAAVLLLLYALRHFGAKREYEYPEYKKRWFGILAVVCTVIAALGVVAAAGVIAINDWQTNRVMLMYLKRMAPWIALVLGAVLALAVLPALKGKKKAVLAVLLVLCVVFCAVWQVFPLSPFYITSAPMVLDTGTDYSVVFATSAKGTGFVEYEYEGASYTVYAQNAGRMIGDRLIHSVRVPYEHLQDNSYSVGSTRVIEQYSYGSRLGKTVKSESYQFAAPKGDTAEFLVLSDWHSYTDRALEAASYFGKNDAVILLGDAAAGMDFEEEAAEFIVKFGGELTGGAVPVIYVRGNHDTRGAFAADLPAYLGLDSLYYTVSMAGVSFIVLDSGEDKEDGHVEYGGMNDFTENRRTQLEWLKDLEVKYKRVIALSHAWQISQPEPDVSAAAWNALDYLGVRFVLSGHKHVCRLLGETDAETAMLQAHPGITAYIDGGIDGDNYVASHLVVSREGIKITAVDRSGPPYKIDESFGW